MIEKGEHQPSGPKVIEYEIFLTIPETEKAIQSIQEEAIFMTMIVVC